MSIQSEIIRLFNSLPDTEQIEVLSELNQKPTNETVPIQDAHVVSCPHCESKLFVKNGKRSGIQNYKCKSCCKIFNSKTGTSLYRLHNPDKFELYKALMLESYYPIKQIAKKIGISIQTAFDWRHKILSGIPKEEKPFEGTTEIDDIWFLYSQKGRKGLDYSRKRGGSKRSGDNDYQAKLLITSDRKKTSDVSLTRIGRIKKADIERKVSGKFSKNCILVSDKHRSIAAFAKSESIKHVSFKAAEHTAGGEYHVQNINNMASSLKGIINHTLKGVSTKYLQNYANWYQVKTNKIDAEKMGELLLKNKKAIHVHLNREGLYKWFIENFSKRTYRCPVKRNFSTALGIETISKLNAI